MTAPAAAADVVVVGAGLSGLVAAAALQARGAQVVLVDKGRSPGGRLATRRIEAPAAGTGVLDHGAQFFTVRSEAFRDLIAGWPVHVWHHGPATAGSVTDDPATVREAGDGHPRHAGDTGMSGIAKHLAAGLDVRLGVRATAVTAAGAGWAVDAEDGTRLTAPRVLVTSPVPQTLDLLGDLPVPDAVRGLRYDACIGLLAVTDARPPHAMVQFDGGPVHVIADNASKGISAAPAVTAHASAERSNAWIDDGVDHRDDAAIEAELTRLVTPWLGGARILAAQVKRWRYAQPTAPHPDRAVAVAEGLVLAGDAFGGPKVEGASLSGLAAAALLAG